MGQRAGQQTVQVMQTERQCPDSMWIHDMKCVFTNVRVKQYGFYFYLHLFLQVCRYVCMFMYLLGMYAQAEAKTSGVSFLGAVFLDLLSFFFFLSSFMYMFV